MKNFGLLKTKIENVLLESYANDTFKNELKTFKKLVIENKNISKLFYLYDELSSPKSLSESYCHRRVTNCLPPSLRIVATGGVLADRFDKRLKVHP